MTKEEIFDKEFYFLEDFLAYKSTPHRLKEIIFNCMQQYADSELTDLKAENSMLADELNKVNGEYQHLIGNVAKLKEYLEAKKQPIEIHEIYDKAFK